MEKFINLQRSPVSEGGNIESKEAHEFTVEEIRQLLKSIDGKERPDLAVTERMENIKGELMSLILESQEKEIRKTREFRVSYSLVVAGQRYMPDGTPGRVVSQTFLTRDFDETNGYSSEEVADYIDGAWVIAT